MANPILDKSLEFSIQITLFNESFFATGLDSTVAHRLLETTMSMGANVNKALYGVDKPEFVASLQEALKNMAECIYLINVIMQSQLFAYDYMYLLSLAEEIRSMLISSINASKKNSSGSNSKWEKYSNYGSYSA